MKKDMAMEKTLSWKKILGLIALILAPFFLAQCGDAGMSAASIVGPTGPTSPSGFYFESTAVPHTIQSGNTIIVRTRVWDSNGNTAGGVTVTMAGDSSDPADAFTTTGGNGWTEYVVKIGALPGSVVFFTVGVENKFHTVPVQVVAGSVAGG